jgi:hypothetical protein
MRCPSSGCRCGSRHRPATRQFHWEQSRRRRHQTPGCVRHPLPEQIHHVLEIFNMAALVGADGNALHVFLQCSGHHLIHAAVVPQVNHLGTHALQDAAHDVDGRIVPVKQAGRRDKAHFVE